MSKPAPAKAIRSLSERIARLKNVILVTDAMIDAWVEAKADKIEAFQAEVAPVLQADQPAAQ